MEKVFTSLETAWCPGCGNFSILHTLTQALSDACDITHRGACNMSVPFNPMLIAIAAGATFVARAFSGNPEHLAKIMKAAIDHKGYALVDILQPCITFN